MTTYVVVKMRFLVVIALCAVVPCHGMGGLCVATRNLSLSVQIPERSYSDAEKLELLRHLEPEGIAEMRWNGEIHSWQLQGLPPQDRQRVQQAFTLLVQRIVLEVQERKQDFDSLTHRQRSFVKQLRQLGKK